MNKTRVKWAVLLALLSSLFIIAIWVCLPPVVRDYRIYVGASIDKEQRLTTQSGQRLVLVGGSNLAMGINSRKLVDQCQRSTVNMGLHAGLGLPFILLESASGIQAGDLVVLSLEYELGQGDKRILAQLVDINPQANNYLDFSFFDYLRFFVQNIQRCLFAGYLKIFHKSEVAVEYTRNGFTVEGDYTTHHGLSRQSKLGGMIKIKPFDPSENIARINHFIRLASNKKAKVILVFPSYCKSAYQLNKEVIKYTESRYRAELTCPILGKPSSFVFPDSLFYDTVYHLTKQGSEVRTKELALLLSSYCKSLSKIVVEKDSLPNWKRLR